MELHEQARVLSDEHLRDDFDVLDRLEEADHVQVPLKSVLSHLEELILLLQLLITLLCLLLLQIETVHQMESIIGTVKPNK